VSSLSIENQIIFKDSVTDCNEAISQVKTMSRSWFVFRVKCKVKKSRIVIVTNS
jgi:hypothetical protein